MIVSGFKCTKFMGISVLFFILLAAFWLFSPAWAGRIVDPRLKIMAGHNRPQVALTLDLCMGKTDYRILDVLIGQKIPATLFVTGRWLRNNEEAVKKIRAHPALFEIANHGANHVPLIDNLPAIYGIKTAGSPAQVCDEVLGGMKAIEQAGLASLQGSRWYRDATALYSPNTVAVIEKLGFRIAGFSLNADKGASLPAHQVVERMKAAKDGDVVIAHMNQPLRPSGKGVAEGIMALKRKGYSFVKLSDGAASAKSRMARPYKSCAVFLKGQPGP